MAFEPTGLVEIVGIVSCGGCPGKRAVARAKMMVDRGAEAIALASCITKGNPVGMPSAHESETLEAIRERVGENILIPDWTHRESTPAAESRHEMREPVLPC